MLTVEAFFEARSAALVNITAFGLIFVIGAIDLSTGPVLTPGLLYLIPIGLVAWHRGKWMGVVMAGASSLMWLAADLSGGASSISVVPYEGTLLRFLILAFVAAVMARLRATLQIQRDLAEALGGYTEELQALNDLKDTLLHAISHDLRGSISAILVAVQTLQRAERLGLTPEQRADLLRAVRGSARKLNRMVNDLLDLERLDRGMIEPECEPADLSGLARSIVEEADFLEEHLVSVEAQPLVMSVDAGKVERILENLLINASKHTPPGTRVTVRVASDGEGALMSVEDDGPGIPDDAKTAIFEPFRQGADARGKKSGTGIGLSLVQRFAELHGGRVWVEDRAGGGTSFFIWLPGPVLDQAPSATGRLSAAASVRAQLL